MRTERPIREVKMEIDETLKAASKNAISKLCLNDVTFSGLYFDAKADEWHVHFRRNSTTYFPVLINLDKVLFRTGSTDIDALTDEIVRKLQEIQLAA
jgi:hypothetical protein